jgi:hypothetical protein avisC_11520
MDKMSTFHHAYNGIPTVDNSQAVCFDADAFGYRSLDHIARDRLSGFIDIEITTMTPTLPGFKTRDGTIAVPSRSGNPDGATSIQDALIPATALKGMLSSAYEAVTMSRLRIFDKQHTRTLSHRPPARKAQSTYPAFLTSDGDSWELVFTFKKKVFDAQFWTGNKRPQTVGLIDSTAGDDGYSDVAQLRRDLPHLTAVRYRSRKVKIQKDTTREIATEVRFRDRADRQVDLDLKGAKEKGQYIPNRGFVVRTRSDDHTISESERKRYEFIFPFVEKGSEKEAYRLQVDRTIMEQFLSTLHDYARNTLDEAQRLGYSARTNTRDGRDAAAHTALSNTPRLVHNYLNPQLLAGEPFERIDITDGAIESYLKEHLKEVRDKNAPGIPVFVSVDINKDDGTWKLASIKISPVGRMIGKDSASAYKLAQDQNRDPASSLDIASPGDSMWGFIPQTKDNGETPAGGLSGRILLEPAYFSRSSSSSLEGDRQLLKVHHPAHFITLASPKPRTGVPYLRDSEGHNLERRSPGADRKNPIPRERAFLTGQTLVRKVYPTHRELIDAKVTLPESTTDTAMASKVTSWIEPKAVFLGRIHFTNLSERELAILLWLLKPNMLSGGVKKIDEGYHHLGFGKPLGMGTVRVNAISCCLVSGSTLAQQYISLNGVNGHFSEIALENGQTEKIKNINIQGHIDDHLPTKFTASLPVKCFRRQACGWQDGLPVCYPTEQPKSAASSSTSDNPTLTWFRKREDNRVKLASLYDHANAERKQIEDAESQFGPYSFPTLDE